MIDCAVVLDLVALVADGVASPESERLVREHAELCGSCRAVLEAYTDGSAVEAESVQPDDKRVLKHIHRSLLGAGSVLLMMGLLLGVMITGSADVFYNFLLMPVVGVLGYLVFRRRWYIALAGTLALSFIGVLIREVLESGFEVWMLQGALAYAVINTVLATVGVAIAALLCFAFHREKREENQ